MKAVLQLVRLPAGLSAISNIIAAHVLVTQGHVQWGVLSVSVFVGLCLYFGGMGLNDCFDFHDDRKNRSNRPLPTGEITLGRAWAISLGLLIAGVLASTAGSFASFSIAVLLVATIVLYDSKVLSPVASAIAMGACRYLNWLLAMSFVGWSSIAFQLPVALFFYVVGLTLLSKAETRAETKKPLYQSIVFFLFSALMLFYQIIALDVSSALSWIAVFLFAGFLLRILLPLSRNFTTIGVQASVGKLVMGVIIVDATVLAINGYPVLAACILLLTLPGKWLGRWLYVS